MRSYRFQAYVFVIHDLYIQIKLYLQKQVEGWIELIGCSLLTPELKEREKVMSIS